MVTTPSFLTNFLLQASGIPNVFHSLSPPPSMLHFNLLYLSFRCWSVAHLQGPSFLCIYTFPLAKLTSPMPLTTMHRWCSNQYLQTTYPLVYHILVYLPSPLTCLIGITNWIWTTICLCYVWTLTIPKHDTIINLFAHIKILQIICINFQSLYTKVS